MQCNKYTHKKRVDGVHGFDVKASHVRAIRYLDPKITNTVGVDGVMRFACEPTMLTDVADYKANKAKKMRKLIYKMIFVPIAYFVVDVVRVHTIFISLMHVGEIL